MQEMQVQSLGGENPWRRNWQPTPVFLPGKSYEQRSMMGYSPWGLKSVRHDLATKQQRQQQTLSLLEQRDRCTRKGKIRQ